MEIDDLVCPKCGGGLSIDSNSSMQISQISCDDCEFVEDFDCPEDVAVKRFYKKYKGAMKQYREE